MGPEGGDKGAARWSAPARRRNWPPIRTVHGSGYLKPVLEAAKKGEDAMKTDRYAALLRRVEKPGRYTGGEFGEVYKENMPVRMLLLLPRHIRDRYVQSGNEDSHRRAEPAGFPRLRALLRALGGYGGRAAQNRYEALRAQSGDPLDAFDVVAFTMQYELFATPTSSICCASPASLRWRATAGRTRR